MLEDNTFVSCGGEGEILGERTRVRERATVVCLMNIVASVFAGRWAAGDGGAESACSFWGVRQESSFSIGCCWDDRIGTRWKASWEAKAFLRREWTHLRSD